MGRWPGCDLGERKRGLLEGGHRIACRWCPRRLAPCWGLLGKYWSSPTDFQMPGVTVTFPVTCACCWFPWGTHRDNVVWAVGKG